MKTYSPKPEHIVRRWYVIDASGLVLGRLASEVAAILRGKHKPIFAPHMDVGDNVIVVNASQIELTGGKEVQEDLVSPLRLPRRHQGDPLRHAPRRPSPTFVIEKAVRGMLPKNSLGRSMIKKLHVVAGAEHPHQAQQPVPYTLGQPPVWEGLPEKQPRPTRKARDGSHTREAGGEEARRQAQDDGQERREVTRQEVRRQEAAGAQAGAPRPAKKTTARKTTARKSTAKKDEEES